MPQVRILSLGPRRRKLRIACDDFLCFASKVISHSLRCSSFPNRTHFVGLRFGFQPAKLTDPAKIPEKPPVPAVFLHLRHNRCRKNRNVRIIVHRACYDGTIPERQVRFMFYYSKRSHRRIVHMQARFLVRGFAPETIGTFETLSEALDAGYRLCRRCNPILRQYRKEQMAILDYCRENGMSFHLNDRYLSIISPISQWRVAVSPSGTTMLYHKNTEFRASDAASAIRGYHNQHIRFRSLPEYFSYITSHDAYRMHHPEAPRAALTKKPPKQKEPPRKGTKRWHKEQTRRRAAERRRAIRNVLALIDSLDTNCAARPAV